MHWEVDQKRCTVADAITPAKLALSLVWPGKCKWPEVVVAPTGNSTMGSSSARNPGRQVKFAAGTVPYFTALICPDEAHKPKRRFHAKFFVEGLLRISNQHEWKRSSMIFPSLGAS